MDRHSDDDYDDGVDYNDELSCLGFQSSAIVC